MKKQKKSKKSIKRKKQNNKNKYILTVSLLIFVPVLCLLAAYVAGIAYYKNRFLRGTVIDRVDVSGMTISELEEQIKGYSLKVIERQADGTELEEEIPGSEIGISYISTEPLRAICQEQNRLLWFLNRSNIYETGALPFYVETALEEKISGLRGFKEEFIEEPEDAYITDYDEESGFTLVAERPGNHLNRQRTTEVIKAAVDKMEPQIILEEAGCYEEPEVTLEDAKLQEVYARLQNYANMVISYTFGVEQEVLDGNTIIGWITVDGYQITVDREQVQEFVASLRKKHDTIFRPRKFLTSYGTEVAIEQGDYGWWMDTEQETQELAQMLEKGESGERTPVYRQTAASYEKPDYGNTYVEINLTAQHLFFYQDGSCILESDFVSGNPSRGNGTPAGIYGITYKQRDATLTGENYRTPVSFWMPFNNNVGMHDASWRSEFGGDIYLTNGSHGCINLPYSIAQEIYEQVEKGTPVICYYLPGTEPAVAADETAGQEEGVPEGTAAEPGEGMPEETDVYPKTGWTEGEQTEPVTE